MKNNKTLRLAEAECGAAATFPAHQGRAPSRQKKPAAVSHPGIMRNFCECSFLEDSRYASQIIFMASKPAFVSRAERSASHKRVHARLRRAMASGALQTRDRFPPVSR